MGRLWLVHRHRRARHPRRRQPARPRRPGPVEAVREQFEPRLHLVPRLRQLLYPPSLGRGWPLWVDAPTFDLADHIRVCPVAAPGGQAQLLAACQELAERRLDPARPLWELWLLPGLPDRRVGAYLRLHHVLADGAAALAVFGALLDQAANAPAPAAPAWSPAPTQFPAKRPPKRLLTMKLVKSPEHQIAPPTAGQHV